MPHVELPQAVFKVVMLGDTFTGKTSLVLRFAEGRYRGQSVDPTVGASFVTKRLTVQGITAKVQIWDTAGQEQFKRLAPMYYKNAAAAILCYDVTSPKSFETLEYWMDKLKSESSNAGMVVAMCATKCDLDSDPDTSQAEALAKQTGSFFIKTSAKTNSNVQLLFQKVMENVLACHGTGSHNPLTPGSLPRTPDRPTRLTEDVAAAQTPSSSLFDEKKSEPDDHDDVVDAKAAASEDSGNSNSNTGNVSRCDASSLMCGDVSGEDGALMGCIVQ